MGRRAMTFIDHSVKGIARYWLDAELGGEPLHLHITEVGPGDRAHPPHRHGGFEAFYMLAGEGTLEIDGESFVLRANEAVVFDPQKLHGLVNQSAAPMRYMVVLVQESSQD
jgi:quercetin dioxygenase-like cupin family protein